MTGKTHAIGGLTTLWLLPLAAVDSFGVAAAFAVLGALLPDLDAPISELSATRILGVRPLVPVAIVVNRLLGHRGVLHALPGLFVCTLVCWWLVFIGWYIPAAAMLLGFMSHLALDACTISGIPFLYPFKKSRHLLPAYMRVRTGSGAEDVVFLLLAFIVVIRLIDFLFV
jgi:Predicted membrane-bound metal-dependent hydrolases